MVSYFICQMMSTYFCLLISDELYVIWGMCDFFFLCIHAIQFSSPYSVKGLGDCSFKSKTPVVCHLVIRESSVGRAGTLFHCEFLLSKHLGRERVLEKGLGGKAL